MQCERVSYYIPYAINLLYVTRISVALSPLCHLPFECNMNEVPFIIRHRSIRVITYSIVTIQLAGILTYSIVTIQLAGSSFIGQDCVSHVTLNN